MTGLPERQTSPRALRTVVARLQIGLSSRTVTTSTLAVIFLANGNGLQEAPLHAQENSPGTREILGDHCIEQTRCDTTLNDQFTKGRSGGESGVVVKRIPVAGHL